MEFKIGDVEISHYWFRDPLWGWQTPGKKYFTWRFRVGRWELRGVARCS